MESSSPSPSSFYTYPLLISIVTVLRLGNPDFQGFGVLTGVRGRSRRYSGVEQGHFLSKASFKAGSSVVTKWMDNRYVLGFAPALRFRRSQILYRFHKIPSDETININRGPLCVYACRNIT